MAGMAGKAGTGFRASEKGTLTSMQKARWRKPCTEGWGLPAVSGLKCLSTCLLAHSGGWYQTPGKGLVLATWRQPEGARVSFTTTKGVWEKAWVCQRDKGSLLGDVRVERWARHKSFFLPASMGSRVLSIQASEMCVSHSWWFRLQKQEWTTTSAIAAPRRPVSKFTTLPITS